METGSLLDVLVLVVLGALVFVAAVARRSLASGAEQAARDQASEIVARVNWSAVLEREMARTRGTERQEIRFLSYGKLWSAMRPLAIYDEAPFNSGAAQEMSGRLSDWYFSETGGLLLTRHNRDLYFALQDVLRTAAAHERWEAHRIDRPERVFRGLMERTGHLGALRLMKHLDEEATRAAWPGDDIGTMAGSWRTDVRAVAGEWMDLGEGERFALLQQVASVLRTGLTNDVESRLR